MDDDCFGRMDDDCFGRLDDRFGFLFCCFAILEGVSRVMYDVSIAISVPIHVLFTCRLFRKAQQSDCLESTCRTAATEFMIYLEGVC
jgi:hypothetical protein